MMFSPCGAQAGVMQRDRLGLNWTGFLAFKKPRGHQLREATRAGMLDEMQTLIAAGANVEESDTVSDGAGAGVAAFLDV